MNLRLGRPMLTAVLIVVTLLAPAAISPRAQGQGRVRTYDYDLNEVALHPFLKKIGESECVRVVVDPSVEEVVKTAKVNVRINNASPMRVLKAALESHHLSYEYADYKTLVVFRGLIPRSVKLSDMIYRGADLRTVVNMVAEHQGFKALLISPNPYLRVDAERTSVSTMRGFEDVLKSYGFTYQRVDCNTIMVFRDESSEGR